MVGVTGASVGENVSPSTVGRRVVGPPVGSGVGALDVGGVIGEAVGVTVAVSVGAADGDGDIGPFVGIAVTGAIVIGAEVGRPVAGVWVGEPDGPAD